MAISEEAKKRLLEAKQTVTNPTEQQSGFSASTQERLQAYKEWGAPILQQMDNERRAQVDARRANALPPMDFTADDVDAGRSLYETDKAAYQKALKPYTGNVMGVGGNWMEVGKTTLNLPKNREGWDGVRDDYINEMDESSLNEFYARYKQNPDEAIDFATKWQNDKALDTKSRRSEELDDTLRNLGLINDNLSDETNAVFKGAVGLLSIVGTPLDFARSLADSSMGGGHYSADAKEGNQSTFTNLSAEMAADVKKAIEDNAEWANLPESSFWHKWLGMDNVVSTAYDVLNSSLQSRLLQGTMGNASLAFYFTSAYVSALNESLAKGETEEKATGKALIAGLLEVGTEKFSIDRVMKAKNGKGLANHLANLLMDGTAEMSEELASEIGNIIADSLINADESEFAKAKAGYLAEGNVSDSEATWKAILDFVPEAAYAALSGFFSGVLMSGRNTAVQGASESIRARQEVNAAKESGRYNEFIGNINRSPYMAERENLWVNEKSSDYEVLKRYKEVRESLKTAEIKSQLEKAGVTEKLDETAQAIYDEANGYRLTNAQKKLINTETAKKVLDEYSKGTETPGTVGWVEKSNYEQYVFENQSQFRNPTKVTEEYKQAHFDNAAEATGVSEDIISRSFAAQDGISVERYENALDLAYTYGRTGTRLSELSDQLGLRLDEAINLAYKNGVEGYTAKLRNDKLRVDKSKVGMTYLSEEEAQRRFGEDAHAVDMASLEKNTVAKAQIEAVEKVIHKVYGVNVGILDSRGSNSVANGQYDPTTNTIYIDVSARSGLRENAILPTTAHELGHDFKRTTPEIFLKMRDFVIDRFYGNKKSFDAAVQTMMASRKLQAERMNDPSVALETPEDAVEELVCNSLEKVFDDPELIDRLAQELDQEKTPDGKTFLERVIEWLDGLIKRLKAALAELTSSKGNQYAEMLSTKDLEHLRDLFVQAAREIQGQGTEIGNDIVKAEPTDKMNINTEAKAVENRTGLDGASLPLDGTLKDGDDHAKKYSVRSSIEAVGFGYEEYFDNGVKKLRMTYNGETISVPTAGLSTKGFINAYKDKILSLINDNEGSPLNRLFAEAIDETMTKVEIEKIKDIYATYLATVQLYADDIDMGKEKLDAIWKWAGTDQFKAIKANSDKQYKVSNDMSSVCVKTEAVLNDISDYQVKSHRGVTPAEVMRIYFFRGSRGYQTPCPFCYVFSHWIRMGQLFETAAAAEDFYKDRLTEKGINDLDYWKAEYKKQAAWAEKNKTLINKAKSDIADIPDIVDEFCSLLPAARAQGNKTAEKKIVDTIDTLNERYVQAFNVVAQSDFKGWIGSCILKIPNDGGVDEATTYDDYKIVDRDILFDLRRVDELVREYPAMARFRTSKGSAGGKAVENYADNKFGEVISGIASNASATAVNTLLDAPKEFAKQFVKAQENAKKQMLRGGNRLFSWSDNRQDTGPDMLLNFIQLQAIGAGVQAYTKQIEGLELVAAMGGYINASLVAKGKGYEVVNGKEQLVFSDRQGINADTTFELNKRYDRAGNILVGMNYNHIRIAMADDRIFFIIPWHRSSLSNRLLNRMMELVGESYIADDTIDKPTDYTAYQEEISFSKHLNGSHEEEKAVASSIVKFWQGLENNNTGLNLGKAIVDGKVVDVKAGGNAVSESQYAYRELRAKVLSGKALTDTEETLVSNDYFLSQIRREMSDVGIDSWGIDDIDFIYPYEYWDHNSTFETADRNGLLYLEYCRRLGVAPKFSGFDKTGKANPNARFYNLPGYWKTLPDRRMYDREGNYQSVTQVKANKFLLDLITNEGLAERKEEYAKIGLKYETSKRADSKLSEEIYNTVNADMKFYGSKTGEREIGKFKSQQEDLDDYRKLSSGKPIKDYYTEGKNTAMNQTLANLEGTLGVKAKTRPGKSEHAAYEEARARYYRSAGETESRDVQSRLRLTETERENTRPDIDQTDRIVRFSTKDTISVNMSDAERSAILEKKQIRSIPVAPRTIPSAIAAKIDGINDWQDINAFAGSEKKAIIRKLAEEFGAIRGYYNPDVSISFGFSKNKLDESYAKQGRRFEQFAKIFSCLENVIQQAVGVEVHNRNEEGYKYDPDLNAVYVLLSAFEDNGAVVPVKLEVKEFKRRQNSLHVVVSGIETENSKNGATKKPEVLDEKVSDNRVANLSRSGEISIPQLMRLVNPLDTSFTKYFPSNMLTNEQRKALSAISAKDAPKQSTKEIDTPPLKTLNNSVIRRSNYGVGKDMGSQIYVHKNYADEIVPSNVWDKAVKLLPDDFSFNTVMYDKKKPSVVRFDEAPDFDTAREPHPGKMLYVDTANGTVKPATGNPNFIWHHKWQWVKNDYEGFDVQESYNWSKEWLKKITNPSGSLKVWNETLEKNGLPLDKKFSTKQEITSEDTSLNQTPSTFTNFQFSSNDRVLDWGGGRYDAAKTAMETVYPGIAFEVYDPFNRAESHNKRVLDEFRENPATKLTINNVLNVIKEESVREDVLRESKQYLADNGVAYILIHPGTPEQQRAGGGVTTKGWQNAKQPSWYLPSVRKFYKNVRIVGSTILASDGPIEYAKMDATTKAKMDVAKVEAKAKRLDMKNAKFSFKGTSALDADFDALNVAEEMEANGYTSEQVRQATGWFKGYDGKWRYEVDDSKAKMVDLERKFGEIDSIAKALDEGENYRIQKFPIHTTLGEILIHPNLYKAYPYLKNTPVIINDGFSNYGIFSQKAAASTDGETITFNYGAANESPLSIIMHEIQHMIQTKEGFAKGSSPSTFRSPFYVDNLEGVKEAKAQYRTLLNQFKNMSAMALSNARMYEYYNKQKRTDKGPTLQYDLNMIRDVEAVAEKGGYLDLLKDFLAAAQDLEVARAEAADNINPYDMYMRTAGEIEARDVQARLDLPEWARKNIRPDIDRTDTIKLSTKDSEYMELAQDPKKNKARLQEMVDEAAMAAFPDSKLIQDGKFRKMWHFTEAQFNEFRPGRSADPNGIKGMYFAPTNNGNISSKFGDGKQYYLNVTNPKVPGAKEHNKYADQLRKMQKGVADEEGIADVNRQFVEETGVDGFVDWMNGWYTVLTPEQIKSADPVTYDDDGNIIPLSERFNESSNDIRYSLKEDLSPNEYLASAVLDNIRKPEDRAGLEEYLNRHKELYQETTNLSNEITDLENKLHDSTVLSDSDRESIESRIKALRKDVRENEKKMWDIVSKPRMQRIIEQQRATIQEYEDEMAKAEEKSDAKIAELRARMDTKVRAEIDKRIAMRKRMLEQQRTQKSRYYYLPRIEKVSKELRKNLEKAPMPFREPIADFLAALDTRTLDAQGNIKENKANARKTNLIAALNNMSRIAGTTEEWLNKYNVDFNPEMATWIDEMVEYLSSNRRLLDYYGDINLNTLSADMLEGVYKMVRSLNTTLKNLTKSYTNKALDISDEATAVMEYDSKFNHGSERANMLENLFRWKNAQATTVYKRMGDAGWKMYKLLVKGQSKLAYNEREIVDFAESHWKPSDIRKWNDPKKAVAVEIGDEKVMMTPAQMMALYATSRDADGLRHLLEGGGFKLTSQAKGKRTVVDESRVMTEMDLANVINALKNYDEKLIKLTEEIQDFIGKVGAEWGNEVSVARFGYEQFGIENYFPLHTVAADFVGNVIQEDTEAGRFYSMLNRSFTKERTFKANNALVIDGIFDVFASHMSQMALYNAYALPVLDTARFMNWKINESIDGKPQVTTLGDVWDKAFGKGEMQKYLTNLLDSIAGTKRMDAFEAFALAGLRLHNRVAVAANIRVAVQQPFSITRAFDEIAPKYFTAFQNLKALQEEMWRWSGIALWKHQGNYDTNIKGSLTSQVMGAKTAFGQFQDNVSEKAMWLAEQGDDFTWAAIWNACKNYISATQPNLTGDAYMEAVTSKFEDVILLTQVVDTPLQKSDWMRQKSFLYKMTSSFKAEPTTSYNMLLRQYDRFLEAKQKGTLKQEWSSLRGPMLRAIGTFALTTVVNALVTAVIDAFRDDDDYETWLEKLKYALLGDYRNKEGWAVIKEFLGSNIGDSANIFASLPWLADMFEILEGYDAKRVDLEILSSALNSAKSVWSTLTSGDWSSNVYKKIFNLVNAASKLSGLPVANMMRDVVSVWNTVFARIDSSMKLQQTPETKQSGYNAFYDAIRNGDGVRAMQVVDEIASNEIDSKTAYTGVTSVIRKAYQDGKIDKDEALEYMMATNDYFDRGFDRAHIKNQVDGWKQE